MKEIQKSHSVEQPPTDVGTQPGADSVEDRTLFPPGYFFDPNLIETADVQIAEAWREYEYQAREVPSFEDTPVVAIAPNFNPTNADADKLHISGWSPDSMVQLGYRPHSEYAGVDGEPVRIWRIVDRDRLQDGTGITSSAVLSGAPIVDHSDLPLHLSSNHATRTAERTTPFVSFSTDPEKLVQLLIQKHEFGLKGGRDSVVIQATVNPSRILSHGHPKEAEVLLMGGLGPHEYNKAMEIADFVNTIEASRQVDEQEEAG